MPRRMHEMLQECVDRRHGLIPREPFAVCGTLLKVFGSRVRELALRGECGRDPAIRPL
jgi:hypothetical protein